MDTNAPQPQVMLGPPGGIGAVENRVRAAARALGDAVDELPPLRLEPARAQRVRGHHRRRR